MINFLKGVAGGIGNIVPGLSGSALLIILDIYDKCIHAINNLFTDFRNSFKLLFPVGCGILCGTFIFSNLIIYGLNKYPLATSLIFLGFMMGTIPSLIKKVYVEKLKLSYLILFIITFFIGVLLLYYKNNYSIIVINTNPFTLIGMGLLIALSTIIPGISSTVLLSLIGMYDVYLTAINSFNIKILFFIGIGVFIGFILLSKVIDYLLHKYYSYTFYTILGFVISTIPALIRCEIIINKEFFIGLILSIISCFITIKLSCPKN